MIQQPETCPPQPVGAPYPPPAGPYPPAPYQPTAPYSVGPPYQPGAPYPPASYPPPGGHPLMQPVPQPTLPQMQQGPVAGQPPVPPGQQQAINWMPPPSQPVANCPRGLEYLTLVDQVLVKQKAELLEALVGFETANKYIVSNSMGQQVFYMKENTDCFSRQLCGSRRPFDIQVFDNSRAEVMHFNRPLACDNCFFPCCLMELEITAPPGRVIGFVRQDWSLIEPRFTVYAADKITPILKIKGPLCPFGCCSDVKFEVLDASGTTQVGMITKQWSGAFREALTDCDNFGITFPMDLDVCAKASLLGALMLIDFMYFESSDD